MKMRVVNLTSREDVYNAPIMNWNNDTYTPVSNKMIMDLIEDKLSQNNLIIKDQFYRTAKNESGMIKGVIGNYDISSGDGEYGQRIAFRNSYDKSMSFCIVVGTVVFVCENGCFSGTYQYRRIHKGTTFETGSSTTIEDIIENIEGGFKYLNSAFENNVKQLNALKGFEISPKETYDIIGELFFTKQVLNVSQMSIINEEFNKSKNFRHFGDAKFTAYDLYNHITESLKSSHASVYVQNHILVHKLFENVFNI